MKKNLCAYQGVKTQTPTTVNTIYGMETEDRSWASFWQDKEGQRGSFKDEMSRPNTFTQLNTKALIDGLY